MPNPPRILVDAVRRYCAEHGIVLDIRADGWLLLLDHPCAGRRLIFGYDVGLNSAVAHRLASDKAATAELLALSDIPCVPHLLVMRPPFTADGTWAAIPALLDAHPAGLVVKPNEGTSGRHITRVSDRRELERSVQALFARDADVAISPFVDIAQEVRVVLLDGMPLVVYEKQRRLSEWRHNLDAGATPILLDSGTARESCGALAAKAAQAIGVRFASIDLVCVDGGWQVLEINSGVVMEAFGKLYPERVHAAYSAALDRLFTVTANGRPSP
jgi:glutathione synthase/RimK-type ligase-like ATP-grasp enzyme